MAMRRLIESPTDGDSRPSNPSTRRYMPSRPALADDDIDDDMFFSASRDPYAEQHGLPSGVRRRASYSTTRTPQYQGPIYPEYGHDGKVLPRRSRVDVQPRRVTTERQRHTDQSLLQQWIAVSKQTARTLIVSGIIGIVLVIAPVGVTNGLHVVRQQQQGVTPSITLVKVFGHNHDSIEHPTILRAMVSGGSIDFEEVPAGDISKVHGFRTASLKDLGYTGDLSEVYLEITTEHVGNGKIQIRLQATIGGVGEWPFVQPISAYWILEDNGNFFVPPTDLAPKKK